MFQEKKKNTLKNLNDPESMNMQILLKSLWTQDDYYNTEKSILRVCECENMRILRVYNLNSS